MEGRMREVRELRESVLVEKNVVVVQNQKLHEENHNLQEEIVKLKQLNDLL